jgi:uncharacterized protein YjbI with pentapeptide repeats
MDNVEATECDFTEAVLEGVQAHEANFERSVFRYAHMARCDFTGAKLADADLSVADVRGDLSNVDLYQADLRGAKMPGVILKYADLSKAKCDGANMIGADLSHATYTPEQLQNARATGVIGRMRDRKQKKPWWQFWG